MFYEKSLNLKKIKYKKYNYSNFALGMNSEMDENLLPIRYAKKTYNFNFNNGALKTGLGIAEPYLSHNLEDPEQKKMFEIPAGLDVLGCWVFRTYNYYIDSYDNMFIIYCSDGSLYVGSLYSRATNFIRIRNILVDSCPTIINYNYNGVDSVIIGTKENGMWIWNNGMTSTIRASNPPIITNFCLHYERLFATGSKDLRSLWFSDDLNPSNWNISSGEGGFINMHDDRGTLNKVVSFDDYLYVFREFGIARVVAFANQSEFSVTQLYTSSNRIYSKTISVCGDRIMFLASDGVYSFNGVTTTKLSLGIETLINAKDNSNAIGAYLDGCYYLACKMDFFDDEKVGCEELGEYHTNALLEINLKTLAINILRGADIHNMQALNDQLENSLFVCIKKDNQIVLGKVDKCGHVLNEPTKKVWCAPYSDFGSPTEKKLVKKLSLTTKTNITVEIIADNVKKKIKVKGSCKPQTIAPNMSGYNIGINFICEETESDISNPQVIVGLL